MRYIVTTLRILVGLLFIFSGIIKANDPTGFSYKLDEYFTVFADDLSAKQDSFTLALNVNGSATNQAIAFPAEGDMQLVSEQTPWLQLEIEEGVFLYVSQAKVSLNGQLIHEAELQVMDSSETAEELSASLTYSDQTLHTKSWAYANGSETKFVDTIEVGEYQKSNAWYVGWMNGLRDYAVALAMLICVIEIVLGFALLIGWAARFTLSMYLAMLLFFAFLTWYSAAFDKVTDCGCFGDAIKLTPWESFYKDVILLAATLILFAGAKYVRPLFSNPFSVRFTTVVALLSVGFTAYCWHYLPVWDFLQFSEGSDIKEKMKVPEGGREKDHIVREYYYNNGNEQVTVTWDSDDNTFTPDIQKEWTYVGVGEDKILEKRDEPPIHDFKIMDETLAFDYVDDFFNSSRFKLMIVMNDLEKTNTKAIPKIKELTAAFKEAGHEIYPLTASTAEEVADFRHTHQLDFPFYYGDKTNLKSIIRSNPGLVLVDSSSVVRVWPSTRLPKVKKLLKLTE